MKNTHHFIITHYHKELKKIVAIQIIALMFSRHQNEKTKFLKYLFILMKITVQIESQNLYNNKSLNA